MVIFYHMTVPLQLLVWGLDLRLNNIFCYLPNFAYKYILKQFQPQSQTVSNLLW